MGLFDFLFKKKNQPNLRMQEQEVEIKTEIEKPAEKPVEIKTEIEKPAEKPVEEKKYPKLIAETTYSKTYEEEKSIFEYVDFKVVGTSNYQKEIKRAIKLEKENESFYFEEQYGGMKNKEILETTYDEMIFQYDDLFSGCSLVLEPDNQYDSEAIAVYIDSLKTGYVPDKEFPEGKKYIHGLLSSGQSYHLSLSLKGGKYKINRDDEKVETGELTYGLSAQVVIRTDK